MEEPSDLAQCVYISTVTKLMTEEELRQVLVQSRAKNSELGITGMLVYSEGSIMQVLEGPRQVVCDMMERIGSDPRHKGVIRLIFEPITEREFGDWTMGFANASLDDLKALPGCNDFFSQGECLLQMDASKARRLLEEFRRYN
jgi:hypothetical protein